MAKLRIYKTDPSIVLPKFQTEQSACFDVAHQMNGKFEYTGFASNNKPMVRPFKDGALFVNPKERVMVPTGLIFDIPEGYSVRLHARSGLSFKKGLVLANSEAVIDSDYVEETFVLLYNRSDNGVWIQNGDRICQGEMVRSSRYSIEETEERPQVKTSRNGGMGSTGVETKNE